MLIYNFLVLRITWKRKQNIMIDRYGPYDVPLFLCIWDYNLDLYDYLYVFFLTNYDVNYIIISQTY